MSFQELRNKKWFKIVSNKYVLIILFFGVWMFFLDSNSWLVHQELNQEINELNNNKKYYKTEINKDKAIIKSLDDSFELEKFAREKYFMKRENEDVFIIEYKDSLKKD
ncbi:FtsB family cell division protein [Mesonia aquimarina]|uniref:FtsB family cell division protein n=1 Tax=Mesonia aquimarina TaxID=1504967 RepID=UPI000EF5FE8B|nr:septum formation initiator family protein [Mesonia aquimarina]